VHIVSDFHASQSLVAPTALHHEAWNDADGDSAILESTVVDRAHHAGFSAAVNDSDTALSRQSAELAPRPDKHLVNLSARRAIDRNRSIHFHNLFLTPQS
jgi:hypothetical protein